MGEVTSLQWLNIIPIYVNSVRRKVQPKKVTGLTMKENYKNDIFDCKNHMSRYPNYLRIWVHVW